jgi:hypothetical protein
MILSLLGELPSEIELKHPHDLLTRRFLFDVELFVSLLENYGDNGVIQLLDLDSMQCESPVTVDNKLVEVRGDLRFSTKFKAGGYSNVFLFFEHQSTWVRLFSIVALRKILEFYEQCEAMGIDVITIDGKLPFPIIVLLYHGEVSWGKLLQLRDLIAVPPGMNAEGFLSFQVLLIDLTLLTPEQLKGHPALRALLDALLSFSKKQLNGNF